MQKKSSVKKKSGKLKKISSGECLSNYSVISDYIGGGIVEIKKKNKKQYCCMLRIYGIDIFHYSEYDKEQVFSNFAAATSSLRIPHKFVFADAHPQLKSQIEYLEYKLNKTTHKYSAAVLKNQIEYLKNKEKTQRDKIAYLLIFGENPKQLKENAEMFADKMQDTYVELCDKKQISEFFTNYLNGSSNNSDNPFPEHLNFSQNCVRTDDTYQTTVVIYDYPAILKNLEIASLISRLDNVSFVFDVETQSKSEVLRDLKFSLKELKSRSVLNQEVTDEEDTALEFSKLLEIRNNIANGMEQMMYTTLRIIVTDNNYNELVKHVEDIQQTLEDEGIYSFVPINEMQQEYFGRLALSNTIKNPFPLHDTYKMQFPFYYQSHLDPTGLPFGISRTGGMVNIDFFYRTDFRPSYDLMLFGVKGSGKSLTLKSLVQDYLVLGNKIMVLDVESEYRDLAKMFDGQVIKLNKNTLLNTLQMYKVIDSSRENDESCDKDSENAINFASEISRIISFFYQYIPALTELEAEELKDIIVQTYAEKNIFDYTDIETLSPTDFPVFSDVLRVIRKKLYNSDGGFNINLTERKIDTLEKLEVYVKNLAEGMYSSMFNGHSTINISEANLIVFDVKALSEMDSRIYNAQLFNILAIMWAETCKNVEYNNRIKHPFDRRYVVNLIDEAHRFINANNIQVTDYIDKLGRRTRKYDAALWFASQSIMDYNPTGTSEGAEKVRVIFSLIQYKLILKQLPEGYEALKSSFKNFPQSELAATKDFIPGEMLISFGSERNRIHCLRKVNNLYLFYMGNSRDREKTVHQLFDLYYHEKNHEEYAALLADKRQEEHFHKVFTKEIISHYGYKADDSDYLYTIVFNAVDQLIQELLMLNRKAGGFR